MSISTAACARRPCSNWRQTADTSGLPQADPAALGQWFPPGAKRGSLPLHLEGFTHTIAVLQTRAALERVAHEFIEDMF